jgi:hypothetical protein
MSALALKADFDRRFAHVRFVPLADIPVATKNPIRLQMTETANSNAVELIWHIVTSARVIA